jgi:hypothetical protein
MGVMKHWSTSLPLLTFNYFAIQNALEKPLVTNIQIPQCKSWAYVCVFLDWGYVYTPSKLTIGHGSRDLGAKSRKQDTVPGPAQS